MNTPLAASLVVLRAGLCLVGALLMAAPAAAQPQIPQGTVGIELQPVATGLVCPIEVVSANDNSGRLFIVDQTGKILILRNGQVLPTPFLDLTSQIVTVAPNYDERGLLGLAFHPDYVHNGRFFVRYSVPRTGGASDPCTNVAPWHCHSEVLAEFHVSAANPNIADPTGIVMITISKPQFNHNSGEVAFGPDGFLYFGMGDGGGANDGLTDNPPSHGPGGNGQNLNTMLGKLHRIDVNAGTEGQFGFPADNPFVQGGGLPSIFAYGFRNPYRFSFDNMPGGDGRCYMADVGQDNVEEVDIIQNGGNFGWVIKEGTTCFDPLHTTTPLPSCADAGMIDPIAQYFHNVGIAVVGGFLYRGNAVPQLRGKYVFGDFATSFGAPNGHLFYMLPIPGRNASQIFRPKIGVNGRNFGLYLKGIGRDQDGEIYFCASTNLGPTGTNGVILKMVAIPCGSADYNGDGDTGTEADIEAFFACLSGQCCDACNPDFNGDGDSGTDADIEAFFRVLAGGTC
jgi:glucose/arabinose dehydrogenase